MRLLVVSGKADPDGRNGMDDTAHPLSTHKRRSGEGVRKAEVRHKAGEPASESVRRDYTRSVNRNKQVCSYSSRAVYEMSLYGPS